MSIALPATWPEAKPVLEDRHTQVVEAMTSVDGSLDTLFTEIKETRKLIDQLQRTVGLMGQTIESLDASYGRMADELQNMKQAIRPLLAG
ncbi:MAG: hypothetical protein OXC13_15120 [Caldilineaceae bacterium]|nr:hypothetical protein [Caldilineaceae bacterium]